jgi:hypothetical protein
MIPGTQVLQTRVYRGVVLDKCLEMFPVQPNGGYSLQVLLWHRVWRESLFQTFLEQPAAQYWFEQSKTNIAEQWHSQQETYRHIMTITGVGNRRQQH